MTRLRDGKRLQTQTNEGRTPQDNRPSEVCEAVTMSTVVRPASAFTTSSEERLSNLPTGM